MATMGSKHKETTNGVGKCSVPMWRGGVPDGFCDSDAYGHQEEGQTRYGEYIRGTFYPGYCMGLACYGHGGPSKEKALNLCDHCEHCFAECRAEPKFGCGLGNDNVYECDTFSPRGYRTLTELTTISGRTP